MVPNRAGIWEWYEPNGTRRLVCVENVYSNLANHIPWYRVLFDSFYHSVQDVTYTVESRFGVSEVTLKNEWVEGNWGNYLGSKESFNTKDLYLFP